MFSMMYQSSRQRTSEMPLLQLTSASIINELTTSPTNLTLINEELVRGAATTRKVRWDVKINRLMQTILIQVACVNDEEEAQTKLAWLDNYFYTQLDNGIWEQIIPAWWVTPIKDQREAVKQ